MEAYRKQLAGEKAMNVRSKEAFENARSKLDDAKRFMDKGEGINCVADYIGGATSYAIEGWLAAHAIKRGRSGRPMGNYGDSFYAFREQAAFAGSDMPGISSSRRQGSISGCWAIRISRRFAPSSWKSGKARPMR